MPKDRPFEDDRKEDNDLKGSFSERRREVNRQFLLGPEARRRQDEALADKLASARRFNQWLANS